MIKKMLINKMLIKDISTTKYKEIEICGVILEQGTRYLRILDYTGEIKVYKDTEIHSKRCVLRCRVYKKEGINILYCLKYTSISLYEEIFYYLEYIALKKIEIER